MRIGRSCRQLRRGCRGDRHENRVAVRRGIRKAAMPAAPIFPAASSARS
jgi:hypothetical protein